MKAIFQALLLGVLLLLATWFAIGCGQDLHSAFHHEPSTGSGTTTGTGGTDDLGVQQSCCTKSAEDPFEGPDYFVIRTEDDPKDQAQPCEALGLTPGFTAHADPIVPKATCPACECSLTTCALPAEMHASAAKCANADNAVWTDFSPLPTG